MRVNEWENYREIKFERDDNDSSVMMATKLKIFHLPQSRLILREKDCSRLCVCCHSEIDQIYTQFTLTFCFRSYLEDSLKLCVSLNCESSEWGVRRTNFVSRQNLTRLTFFLLLGNHQHVNGIIIDEVSGIRWRKTIFGFWWCKGWLLNFLST